MADDDQRSGRVLAVLAILIIAVGVAGLVFLMRGNAENAEPQPAAEIPSPEPAPESEANPAPAAYAEPAPEILPAENPPEVATEPVYCTVPGDGFVQTPHGFNPMEQYVGFDAPAYVSGYDGRVLPARDPSDGEVCVTVLYDISADGRPIGISVLDVQPDGIDEPYYAEAASREVATRQYAPGARNDKPVRIDNNFLEVRFGAE